MVNRFKLVLLMATVGVLLSHSTELFAQAPERFNYQGVARDAAGTPLTNTTIGLRLRLRSGSPTGTVVYQETHSAVTNGLGLFTVQVGGGTGGSGFAAIDWGTNSYYIQVEMDANGGTAYQDMGTAQLLSVPYALYAKNSGGSATTLDANYDGGGAGAGRTITADAGAVKVQGTDGLQVTGTLGSGATIDLTGAGPRLFFNPKKAAFRAGFVDGTQWNDATVGQYSTAVGSGTTASGESSTAIGSQTTAPSYGETVIGLWNTIYAPVSANAWNSADRLFVVGNGTSDAARSDAVVVNKSGDVGFGLSSPASRMHIHADAFVDLQFTNASSGTTAFDGLAVYYANDGGHVNNQENSSLRLYTNNQVRVNINPIGNTAIGNINPSAKLDVDGQVRIRGGSPGVGKVLTSSADGTATWQPETAPVAGSMLLFNGSSWVAVAPGQPGQTLTIDQSGNPVWWGNPSSAPCDGLTQWTYNGHTYDLMAIGSQCWFAENLRTANYRNGNAIPNVTDNGTWAALTTGAWSQANNSSMEAIYGKLYNWYAVADSRNLCPVGWHVPSDAEWTALDTYLGGQSVAGGKMKTIGFTNWSNPNTAATNSSGFSGLPGGDRHTDGTFTSVGSNGYWWSTSESGSYAWYRSLSSTSGFATRNSNSRGFGYSVRCIKD
jgi:uncharacterized protein (TIGR02145 family)